MQDSSMAPSQLDVEVNDTLLEDLKLSKDDITDFVKLLVDFTKKNHTPNECAGYCEGDIYKWVRAYNGIHGYVSLLASIQMGYIYIYNLQK